MKRLLAQLFGWKLVHLRNSVTDEIRRVRWTAEGEPYCIYSSDHLIWIARDNCGWEITPLNFERGEVFA